jgi:hypothetical protein
MASELPNDEKGVPKWVPLRGSLLGILVGYAVLVAMFKYFKIELDKETELIFIQIVAISAFFLGACLGGLFQLISLGRTADIPRFLRSLFISSLKYSLMVAFPLCLVFWLGPRLHGLWRWVAYVGGTILFCLFTVLDIRWTLRKHAFVPPPEPPPA